MIGKVVFPKIESFMR